MRGSSARGGKQEGEKGVTMEGGIGGLELTKTVLRAKKGGNVGAEF